VLLALAKNDDYHGGTLNEVPKSCRKDSASFKLKAFGDKKR
jgi:hypothetical protein